MKKLKTIHSCGQFKVETANTPGLHLRVLGFPAPLIAGPFPNRHQPDWFTLKKAGIRLIVCLASTTPDLRYDPYPAGLSWLAKEDMPELADCMELRHYAYYWLVATTGVAGDDAYKARKAARGSMKRIAQDVVAALWRNEGVFVHCEYGVERTGLLIALVLYLASNELEEAASSVARGLSPHAGDGGDLEKRLLNVLSFSRVER